MGSPILKRSQPAEPCTKKGCDVTATTRGLCGRHYKRLLKTEGPLSADRPSLDWLDTTALAQVDVTDRSWLADRACVGVKPSVFVRAAGHLDEAPFKTAVAVCEACPVRLRCLALNLDMPHGHVGGTTPQQRRHIRSQLAEAAA